MTNCLRKKCIFSIFSLYILRFLVYIKCMIKKIITLEGKTRHGKNRIREHGAIWSLEEIKVSPAPSALFVKSLKSGVKRWIDQPTDKHFDVVTEAEVN